MDPELGRERVRGCATQTPGIGGGLPVGGPGGLGMFPERMLPVALREFQGGTSLRFFGGKEGNILKISIGF